MLRISDRLGARLINDGWLYRCESSGDKTKPIQRSDKRPSSGTWDGAGTRSLSESPSSAVSVHFPDPTPARPAAPLRANRALGRDCRRQNGSAAADELVNFTILPTGSHRAWLPPHGSMMARESISAGHNEYHPPAGRSCLANGHGARRGNGRDTVSESHGAGTVGRLLWP
jgi:hypothetical protein